MYQNAIKISKADSLEIKIKDLDIKIEELRGSLGIIFTRILGEIEKNVHYINAISKFYNIKIRNGVVVRVSCGTCEERNSCDRQTENGYVGCSLWN